ncbi:class III extradiol ring-cleavage dioxygenase [Dongia sp.]|uniref:DODA-type extradiol aromatic ring-opening family dioxygenase n=1 Tax=Dongia sp. TaxID=1977262 RepID=UPI0035B27EE0
MSTAEKAMRMPVVFISHGSPTLAFDDVPARDFLVRLAAKLPRPKAILCISAHWEAAIPSVTGSDAPSTIHDFYGFPQALYDLRYDAPGDPTLAARVVRLLEDGGHNAMINSDRGLDHGVWSPLILTYPQSGIPVVQLSLMHHRGPADHVALGRLLAPLRDEGILILASGGAVHNLRALDWNNRSGVSDSGISDWAGAFEQWLTDRIAAGDIAALSDYRAQAPHANIAHPSEDHILPLFVALGAAAGSADKAVGERIHRSFTFGSLSMSSYAWGL